MVCGQLKSAGYRIEIAEHKKTLDYYFDEYLPDIPMQVYAWPSGRSFPARSALSYVTEIAASDLSDVLSVYQLTR